MFSQNGVQTIKEGTAVDVAFDSAPGHARTNALGGVTVFPAARRKWSGCAKKAHVFRLSCKIPIINLSEPVGGFAMMKAARWPVQDDAGAAGPCVTGCSDLELSDAESN